jgi:hypothetical protein
MDSENPRLISVPIWMIARPWADDPEVGEPPGLRLGLAAWVATTDPAKATPTLKSRSALNRALSAFLNTLATNPA